MKEVLVTITGTHLHDDVDEESLQFVTEGKLYSRNNTIYLLYDESQMTGLEGCTTRVSITDDMVRMVRQGKAVGIDTEMKFQKGERYSGYYDTDFGPIEMEIVTNSLTNSVTEDGDGAVDIDYNICLKGFTEGRSKLTISVKS